MALAAFEQMSAARRAVWVLFCSHVLGVSFGDDSPSHFLQIFQPEGDFSDCVDAEKFEKGEVAEPNCVLQTDMSDT